jgi:DNA-binding NarL/FixJ family response regulator
MRLVKTTALWVRPKVTQELQIVQQAAQGLTNRDIGQMLYVSHRTISSQLYRTFPKLGVTSRAQLRDVLEYGIAGSA